LSAAKLFAKDAVFFLEVVNDILLLLIHPTGEGNEQQTKEMKSRAHWLSIPLLSQEPTTPQLSIEMGLRCHTSWISSLRLAFLHARLAGLCGEQG
jgi:hypothetical protein